MKQEEEEVDSKEGEGEEEEEEDDSKKKEEEEREKCNWRQQWPAANLCNPKCWKQQKQRLAQTPQ